MADPIVNFFKSTLVGTYSDADNSITIATGDGALLPDPSVDGAFNLTIFEGLQVTGSTEFEIVRVTARSGDVLTVTRGAESTTPLMIGSATHSILMSATKKTFDDINTAIANVDLTTLTNVESITYDNDGNEVFQLPAGTTAQRPNSPQTAYLRWNTDDERIEVYNGSRWAGISLVGLQEVTLGNATATVTANDAVATLSSFIGQFGTPASAFSVRQLGETDVCMRVRRSSDNAEQNIGFTSDGDLDETALTAFVGANDGFVTAWYDQSVDNSTLPAEHGGGATASYSLRKVNSSYTGDAIRVRRASDNTEQDIGFDANGELDTSALDTFVYGATALPADQGSGATASYSLRKVASAYTGDAIRVRRSSDNTEQDIGFVDGELDTSTLETFCSGTNGFVTTWYDQSGSNNATQATAGSQPQIVSSGSTILENGKPAISFDNSGDPSLLATGLNITQPTSYFIVGKNTNSTAGYFIDGVEDAQISRNIIGESGGNGVGLYAGAWLRGNTSDITTQSTISALFNGSSSTLHVNGVQTESGNAGTSGLNDLKISATTHEGEIQEIIVYDSDQSSNRESIEHNQAVFYDIAIDGKEAFVTTWYDQSGSNNATQSTAGSQPKIYDGTTIKENGKPSISVTAGNYLDIASLTLGNSASIFAVIKNADQTGGGSIHRPFFAGADSDPYVVSSTSYGMGLRRDGSDAVTFLNPSTSGAEETLVISLATDNTMILVSGIGTGGTANLYVDGGSNVNSSFTERTTGFQSSYSIFKDVSDASRLYQGSGSELIIYNSDQSSNRESIELNQASYYDIGVSIGATQSTAGSQPKIVSSGTVIKENSQPVVTFDGSDDVLTISGSSSSLKFIHDGGNASIFTSVRTASSSNPTTAEWIAGSAGGSGSNIGLLMGYDDRSVTSSNNKFQVNVYRGVAGTASVEFGVNDILTPNQINLLSVLIDADNVTAGDRGAFAVNGGTLQTGNTDTDAPSSADSTYDFQIGALGNNVAPSDIAVHEFVIYNADKSSDQSNIESNIATYFNITI